MKSWINNVKEIFTGVLNCAPVKISAQYKLVVDKDNNFWLDDYNGYRKIVDKNSNFLPQVSQFLQVKSLQPSYEKLLYGGKSVTKNIKAYHIPIYISGLVSNYPDLFCCYETSADEIQKDFDFSNSSDLLFCKNLKEIGLHKVFEEIQNTLEYTYPLYFNWEDKKVDLYGYSINDCSVDVHTFDLNDTAVNQPYFDVLNNRILNEFSKAGLFYPRFLNIEFEFELDNSKKIGINAFRNVFGIVCYKNSVASDNKHNLRFFLEEFERNQNKFEYVLKHSVSGKTKYDKYLGSTYFYDVLEQENQVSIEFETIDTTLSIHVNTNVNNKYSYHVKPEDLSESISETVSNIADNIRNSDDIFFQVEYNKNSIKLIGADIHSVDVIYGNRWTHYDALSITETDIACESKIVQNNKITKIKIGSEEYKVLDNLLFENTPILRLNRKPKLTAKTLCECYAETESEIISAEPIPFFSYYNDMPYDKIFDVTKYRNDLTELGTEYVQKALTVSDSYYTDGDNKLSENFDNELGVKNIMFASTGSNCFLTPNTLNISSLFSLTNGCVADNYLKYNWFLIKGDCPNYLRNNINEFRYVSDFENLPLYSRIIPVSNIICETVFLGVKYQLPLKYANFRFSVVLDPNEKTDSKVSYKFLQFENTLVLVVSKYVDFSLLLGPDRCIDFSLFVNAESAYSDDASNVEGISISGINLNSFNRTENKDFRKSNNTVLNNVDWWIQKDNGKDYFCVSREFVTNSIKFDTIFSNSIGSDIEGYIYNSVNINGVETVYKAVTITFVNIYQVESDYFWCEDIKIQFFDNQDQYIAIGNELHVVNRKQIKYDTVPNTGRYGFVHTLATFTTKDGQQVTTEIISPNTVLTLSNDYFSVEKMISDDGLKTEIKTYGRNLNLNQEIIDKYKNQLLADTTNHYKFIDLFNVNQLWFLVKQLLLKQCTFKYNSKEQMSTLFDNFTITRLSEFTKSNSIKIDGTDEYVKLIIPDIDSNYSIHVDTNNVGVLNLKRIRTAYFPHFVECSPFEFQLKQNQSYNTLWSMYDNHFGDNHILNTNGLSNVSATGIWEETTGFVSTLFCLDNQFSFNCECVNGKIISDIYRKLLLVQIKSEYKIHGNNAAFISSINPNVEQYIKDSFLSFLFNKYYRIDSILINNKRYDFSVDYDGTIQIPSLKDTTHTQVTVIIERK